MSPLRPSETPSVSHHQVRGSWDLTLPTQRVSTALSILSNADFCVVYWLEGLFVHHVDGGGQGVAELVPDTGPETERNDTAKCRSKYDHSKILQRDKILLSALNVIVIAAA